MPAASTAACCNILSIIRPTPSHIRFSSSSSSPPRLITSGRRRSLSFGVYDVCHPFCGITCPFPSKSSRSRRPSQPRLLVVSHQHQYKYHCRHCRGMRIATLQFAPRLGDVEGNMRRADELLKLKRSAATTTATAKNDELSSVEDGPGPGIEELRPDILVLPEMAFTGEDSPII